MTPTFDLWMSRSKYDTLALIINYIKLSWFPSDITIRLFEALNNFNATLAKQMKVLLIEFYLISKVIVYVKDERANLNSLIVTLIFVVSCEHLQLFQLFTSFCFGHVMSKTC